MMLTGGEDERFEFGLDLLVRGLTALARPSAAPPGPA